MSLSKCQISPLNCTFMTRELDDQVDHRFAWGNANLAAVALTTCASFVASSNWAGLSTKRRCLRHCRRRAAMVAVSENTQQPTRETPDLPTYPYRPTNLLTNIQTAIQTDSYTEAEKSLILLWFWLAHLSQIESPERRWESNHNYCIT